MDGFARDAKIAASRYFHPEAGTIGRVAVAMEERSFHADEISRCRCYA